VLTEWITSAEATALVGCHRHTIDRHVQAGDIARRHPIGRKTPTMGRASVEEVAVRRREEQAELERRREARQSSPAGPPDDGEVWLDAPAAALVLGVHAPVGRPTCRGGASAGGKGRNEVVVAPTRR
jgi:hypothetical protein